LSGVFCVENSSVRVTWCPVSRLFTYLLGYSLPLKIYDIERKKEGESSDSVKGNKWYKIKYEIGGIEMPEEGVSEKVRK
jgi:hypothetical protein